MRNGILDRLIFPGQTSNTKCKILQVERCYYRSDFKSTSICMVLSLIYYHFPSLLSLYTDVEESISPFIRLFMNLRLVFFVMNQLVLKMGDFYY